MNCPPFGLVVLLKGSISLVCKCEEQTLFLALTKENGRWVVGIWANFWDMTLFNSLASSFSCKVSIHSLTSLQWDICCNYCVCLVSQPKIGLLLWDGGWMRGGWVFEHGDCWLNNTTSSKNEVYCHKLWWDQYVTLLTLDECSCLCCVRMAKEP